MVRRVIAAMGLTTLLLGAATPAALAECMSWPIRSNERLEVAYAFTARVAEASRDVDPAWDTNHPFEWHVELAVERTYRGRVPDRLAFNGWDNGCHTLYWNQLRTGDRIFIVSNVFKPHVGRVEPFWVMNPQLIVWKRVADRWAFFSDGLDFGSDKNFYPRAARSATTTADILRLVRSAPLPDTATVASRAAPRDQDDVPVLAIAFMLGFVLVIRKPARMRPD